MKVSVADLAELLDILNKADEFRPIVKKILDVLKSYGPEISEIPDALANWFVKNRIAAVKKYEDVGFSRDEAISMTLDDASAIRRIMERKQASK